MPPKIIDPIEDLLSPMPIFLAGNIPAPDVAATGGQPLEGLLPKAPAPASAPTPVLNTAPPSSAIIDPFDLPSRMINESGHWRSVMDSVIFKSSGEGIIDPFEKPSSTVDILFPTAPTPTGPPPIPKKPSMLGELGKGIMQGLYQTKEMAGGLLALGAEALKSAAPSTEPITTPVKQFGTEMMQAAEKSMEPYQGAVPSYKNIGGVGDALNYLSHGIGTLVPMMAVSIASGGIGGAVGKAVLGNAVKRAAVGMALDGVPQAIINESIKKGLLYGIERGALAGGFASSLGMEAGSITAEKVKEGQEIEPGRVMLGAIPAAALDVLPQFSLAKRTGLFQKLGLSHAEVELAEESIKKAPSTLFRRIGKEAGTQFLQEAPTEALQSVFERWSANKDLTSREAIDEYVDSFLIGGAGGALFGGLGGALEKAAPQRPAFSGISTPGLMPPPQVTPSPLIPPLVAATPISPAPEPVTPQTGAQPQPAPPHPAAAPVPPSPEPAPAASPTLPGLVPTPESHQDVFNKLIGKTGGEQTALSTVFTDTALRGAGITSPIKDLVDRGILTRQENGFSLNPLSPVTPGEAPKPPSPAPAVALAGPSVQAPTLTPAPAPKPSPTPAASPTLPGLVPSGPELALQPQGAIRDEEIRSLASQLITGNPEEQKTTIDVIKQMVAGGTPVDDILHNINNELLNASLNNVQEAGRRVSEALGVVEPSLNPAAPEPIPGKGETLSVTPPPTPGVTPKVYPTPSQAFAGPGWLGIGKQAEFFDDKSGRKRVGTISDVVYQGNPPQPSSVTVSVQVGKQYKTVNLQANQVSEPTFAVRRNEYHAALQGLSTQDRKATVSNSKAFDSLLIQNADLFVDPGYIDEAYNRATTDKQMAIATGNILGQARSEAGKVLKIENVYSPIQRAEKLQALKDHIAKEKPEVATPATQNVVAGMLPMGKNTVLKGGEWLDVSYDEGSGKIVLKDGRSFSVDPNEQIAVEQVRTPEETGPKLPAPVEPETRVGPAGKVLPDQARRLEEIRKENPEEAARIERGNVAVGIQKYELSRMGKAKALRQEEMFVTPKAQKSFLPAMTTERGVTPEDRFIPGTESLRIFLGEKPDLRRKQYGWEWTNFIAKNSPVQSHRILAQALLANKEIANQLKKVRVLAVHIEGEPSYYSTSSHEVYLRWQDLVSQPLDRSLSTAIHELVHALSANKIAQNDEFFSTMTRLREIAKGALSPEELAVLNSQPRWRSYAEMRAAGLIQFNSDVYYGLQNNDEFLSQIFSSSAMQEFLKDLPLPEGMQTATKKNLWDAFLEFLSKVLFASPGYRNLLEEALTRGAEIMATEQPAQAERPARGEPQEINRALPEERQFIEKLFSPDFPTNAAEDPNFDPYLGKHRFLLHITDPDLKRWKEIAVLPYWLSKEYPEFTPFLETQERREERRSELKTEKFKAKEPFTFLRGEELAKTEKALITGDAQGTVWTNAELIEKFNLSPETITSYRSVRDTLDDIFNTNLDRAEQAILDRARRSIDDAFTKLTNKIEAHKESEQKAVLLNLLKTAHDLTLSDEQTVHLETLLGEAQKASEKPLKAVKDKLSKFFNEVLTDQDKTKLLADYESAYEKAQAHVGEIRQIVYNSLGGDISDANLDEITKGLVLAYVRTERPANTIKQLREEFGKAKGYFPRDHGRGKYEVYVTREGFDELGQPQTRVIWNHFFNQIQGTIAYKNLKQDPEFNKPGMEIGVRLHKEEPDSSFWRASLANLQRLTDNAIETLKQKGAIPTDWADSMKYEVLNELSDQFKARGAARHFIHRADYLIGGYKTTGLNEVLNDYISGWAGMTTKQDAAGKFLEAMKGIPKDKPKLKNYAFQYVENQLRNDENLDRVLGKMRGLVFTYFLGGSLRGALVNSTQTLTTTIPWLSRETGWKSLRAEMMVSKAGLDLATGKVSEIEKRLLEEVLAKGITEAQYINTVIREAGDRFGKTLGKIVDLLAKPFSWIESKNREVAALSYFRVKYPELIKTMSEEEAYNQAFDGATDFVNRTQFLMTKGNLPNWASGGDVGGQFFRTAYTFRKFNHNYLLSLRNSMKGPDGKLALDVVGRSLAYVALLGGMTALPFLDDLLDEWEKLFGSPIRRDIKRGLRVIGGPALEKMGIAGIPAIVGIDISGSLKMGIPFTGTPSESIFGVWAGLGRKLVNAKDSAERGDILRAIESASPAFIEAVLKAYRMTEYGATTPTGKILFDEKGRPIKETAGEGILQAFGFRPERIAEASRTHREFGNIEANFAERRNNLYAKFRLSTTADERRKVINEIQRFNLDAVKYRGSIPLINAQSIRQALIARPEKRFMLWGAQP